MKSILIIVAVIILGIILCNLPKNDNHDNDSDEEHFNPFDWSY